MKHDQDLLGIGSLVLDPSMIGSPTGTSATKTSKADNRSCEQTSPAPKNSRTLPQDTDRAPANAAVADTPAVGRAMNVMNGASIPADFNHASLASAVGLAAVQTATAQTGAPATSNDALSRIAPSSEAAAALGIAVPLLTPAASNGSNAATTTSGSMTVTTDEADYAPGSMATFTVSGLAAGSPVVFRIADLPNNPGINGVADIYTPFTIKDGGVGDADGLANGTVVAQWQVPANGTATGATLRVTATSGNLSATTTFSDAPNKISIENALAGTPKSVWSIHGSIANQGDSQIEGFTTQISANAGQTISFKIDTASSGYTLDIYRLGYYGGNGARLITSMHHTGADNQPDPLFNDATNTVDAGNWSVTDSWNIPSSAVSGVYFAKLTTDSGNFQNMVPFIVRNDGTTSDLLFQTSDTTWEAYNPWGGYNLYQGPGGQSDRAYAVSYNRPIAMNSTVEFAQPADFLFGEEYAAIYWLEQNGYNVSYISGIDAATNPALLRNTNVYMDVGHDEYWSQSQFANVKAAGDAGVDLAFLSGNQIYWDTELAPSFDSSHTANRTVVEYKDIWSGTQLDPNGTANGGAGLFRDPQYGPGTPENSLSGTIFTVDDTGTLDNISIPASMAQLRFWRNTSVASGNGGTLTRLLGYEWDSDLDNSFRPAGLIDMSSTTRNVSTLLLDNGATTGSGTATHSLTLYRDTTSGALVFGAGTVMWSWGLSNQYAPYRGLTAPVSTAVQQSMVNLFADMGVQPATLQASLIIAQASTDHTAPTTTITSPTGGTSLSVGQNVTITGTAADVGGRVAGIEVSTDGGTSWHPATGTTSWSYTWVASGSGTHIIEARATDDSVNTQASPSTVSVSVGGTSSGGPSLFSASSTPAQTNLNDGTPLEVGMKFSASTAGQITALKFYRSPGDTGPDLLDLWTATGTKLASATFSNTAASGWQTVNLATPVNITANTTYIASYHTTGAYVTTNNFFTSAVTNGTLTAPSSASSGGNGVYSYGGTNTAGIFPTSTFGSANYWADVVFAAGTGGGGGNTAPTAVADTGDATEKGGVASGTGGSPASGNVLTNDTDPDAGDTKTVTAVSFGTTAGTLGSALAGAHGSIVLSAAGAFTYTVNETDAAVQALRLSTNTITDVFNYTMRDTAGATSSTTLTVTIHGANDAPVLASQTPNQNAVVGSAFSFVLPAGTFTDVDAGDTLAYTATLADGTALPSWLSFNASTRTFSGTPAAANVGTISVRATAADLGALAANETFSIAVTTTAPPPSGSLFSASNTPAQTNLNDGQPLEVGLKFTASTAGQITALKFYRSPGDTGPDLLDLWTATGTKLASVTFSNTAASGWQTVTLTTPVSISANTTYIASYHTTGAYVVTNNFFTSAVTSGSLTAPSSASSGGNGVYSYGGTNTAGIFPANTFGASNYWADVVFTAGTGGGGGGGNTAPTAVADTGDATEKGGVANGTGGSPASGNVLTNDTDPDAGDTKTVTAVSFASTAGTLGTALAGAHGSLVLSAAGAFTYTVNETDTAVQALRLSTNTITDTFNYTMRDTAGATSSTTLTVTIHGANDAPVLASQTPDQNAVVGSAFSFVLPATTFTDVDAGDTLAYTATLASGAALPSWLTFNASTRTFSGTPAAANVGTISVRATATDLGALAANETFNIAVTTTAPPASVSLFTASNTPAQTNLNDGTPLEVGMKFTASTAGQITALKFYRSPGDTGPDLLDLWSATGTNLASATFTNTAASGWQTVNLTTPVNITANTTYIASYHTSGAYVATDNFFTSAVTSGQLTAPSSASSGGNGVYAYGGTNTAGLFPTNTFASANYWADVVFKPQLAA
jgi:VCBS repeat-containing protein